MTRFRVLCVFYVEGHSALGLSRRPAPRAVSKLVLMKQFPNLSLGTSVELCLFMLQVYPLYIFSGGQLGGRTIGRSYDGSLSLLTNYVFWQKAWLTFFSKRTRCARVNPALMRQCR